MGKTIRNWNNKTTTTPKSRRPKVSTKKTAMKKAKAWPKGWK